MNHSIGFSNESKQSQPVSEKYMDDYEHLSRKALIDKVKSQQKHEKALLKHIEHLRKFRRKRQLRKKQDAA